MGSTDTIYIYPDVALVVSLGMNFLILFVAAKFLGKRLEITRIFLAALAGAVYSFFASFPNNAFLHFFLIKVLFSFLMTAITILPSTLAAFMIFTMSFYIVSFLMGGLLLGIIFFIQSGPFYGYLNNFSNLLATYLLPAMMLFVPTVILIVKVTGWLLSRRINRQHNLVNIRVWFNHLSIQVDALIDTGNSLQDPISHKPVVVVEYVALKNLFNTEICAALEKGSGADYLQVFEGLSETPWVDRFLLIPFSSLGKQNGLLVGFRPDLLEISQHSGSASTSEVIIGLYQNNLSCEGAYNALLHPGLMNLDYTELQLG